MTEKNKLLTIGQFAALHGINKKTLMWYDETGLFKPAAINPENGYRCYNYHQSPILETILLLRELGVSITDMDTLLTMDLSEISIVEKKERCLVTVDIDRDVTFEKKVELITTETARYRLGRLHDASYGSMIPVSSLLNKDYYDYSKLFIEIPFLQQKKGLHIQPGGKYLRAFHKGSWDELPLRYQTILEYARTQEITLSGFSYEKGINETVIDRIEDYITQIEIPILG